MNMKIRVCEDDPILRAECVNKISKAIANSRGWTVEPIDDAKHHIGELLARQASHLEDGVQHDGASIFDETDVLVVDYDLTMIDSTKARHTGEELARLTRLYSNVGYVIVTNQGNRSFDFDLTLLGKPRSYADLNIPAETLRAAGLWSLAAEGDFNPWGWDDIPATIAARASLTDELSRNGMLDANILDYLEIPSPAVAAFDDDVYEFLNPEARDEAELRRKCTFRAFLQATTEKKALDRVLADDVRQASIVAISRLSKCFSRLLLGPQSVLVDVPHLLERYPFLMAKAYGDPADVAAWAGVPAAGLAALDAEVAKDCAFQGASRWIGKEALWWPLVEQHASVSALRAEFKLEKVADVAFAEDVSAFIPFEDATEFRAAFHNRFDRRYVQLVEGYQYGPSRRLAFV